MADISIRFTHGLGDASNAAHLLKLWKDQGFSIEVETTPDKAPLFSCFGCDIVPRAEQVHKWLHPSFPSGITFGNDWVGNKTGFNLVQQPLPFIGEEFELWPKLLEADLGFSSQVNEEQKNRVDQKLKEFDLPGKLILLHSRGNTSPGQKSFTQQLELETVSLLLRELDCSIIFLDWDSRVASAPSYRTRHIIRDWKGLNLSELWALMERADLLIGVDSGPLHFARTSKVPAIGVWFSHYPTQFAIPREQTIHLVGQNKAYASQTGYRRNSYQLATETVTAESIVRLAKDVLNPAQGWKGTHYAFFNSMLRKLNHYGGKLSSLVDREKTFRLFLDLLPTGATVVETGCVRSVDDFSAGYSSFIFGYWLARNNGQLFSVDLSRKNCEFCRRVVEGLPVTVIESDSVGYLNSLEGSLDAVYLDSLDTDQRGFAEHCLAEVQAIENKTSVILIDDTVYRNGDWAGKGQLAVPYLLSIGWRILESGYQTLLTK